MLTDTNADVARFESAIPNLAEFSTFYYKNRIYFQHIRPEAFISEQLFQCIPVPGNIRTRQPWHHMIYHLETIFLEGTRAVNTYADVDTITVRFPPYARQGREVKVTVWLKNTGGGTSYFIARETGIPTDGTEQSTASATYVAVTSVITIPDGTWADAEKTISLRLKTDGTGTADASSDHVMANLRISDA